MTDEPRRLSYARVILAAGFVMLFLGTGTRYVFGLALIPMTEDLSLSRSALSSALTLFMVVSALAMPIVGRLIDRRDIRVVMGVGAATSALAITLTGFVSAGWQIFPLYGLLYAVGFATTTVAPVSVLMSRWFPENRGLASSVAITGNGAGQLVIIALLTSFLSSIGWRTAYVALGLINAVVVVPIALLVIRSHPSTRRDVRHGRPSADDSGEARRGQPTLSIATSRSFWALTVLYAVCGAQDFFVATHIVAFAQDQGVSPFLAGNILAFMGLAALMGVLLSGALADRMGAAWPTMLCFVIRIALFAYIPFFQDTFSVAAFALIFGFTFTMTAPLTVVFASDIFGTSRLGSVSGLVNMVHQIAGGLGAVVGAVIFDATDSYDGAFFLMLALALIAAVATLIVRQPPRSIRSSSINHSSSGD